MNKAVTEYRKASAEKLGLKIHRKNVLTLDIGFYVLMNEKGHVIFSCGIPDWQPDKDANQMLMVWELMKKEDAQYEIQFKIWSEWFYMGKDIKLATMEAFMEYIEHHDNS